MWGSKFRSYWYIWNQSRNAKDSPVPNIIFLYSESDLSWIKGIELAVKIIMNTKQNCEYIFTHDDDLKFRINKKYSNSNLSMPDTLESILNTYHPAIASFPWKIGDENIPAMKELAELYSNEAIAPLTGFDNGMVIYHRSIVNFFIPFSPRGEGGFKGNRTLCAHFLQMFAHLLFNEHAIRLNILEYDNYFRIDNLVHDKKFSQNIRFKQGLAYVPDFQHPYEFPQNEEYKTFLSSGLKQPFRSWGRTLTKEYNLIKPSIPEIKTNSFGGTWLVNRLNRVYDLRHQALSNNEFLAHITDKQKLDVLQQTSFSLRIIILTMNRSHSFRRLWKSLMNAHRINRIIKIFIYVDFEKDDIKRHKYLKYLKSLKSLHGDVNLIVYSTHRGLKTIMMESWQSQNNDEYALFFEDDIEVSSYFLLYIDKLVKAYFYGLKLDKRLFGISLYNQRFNEVIDEYVSVSNGHQPYLYQLPQSWGALYAPNMWREFLFFLNDKNDTLIPNSYTNRWPFKNSWKKYLLRYMLQEGGYLIYPNFPNNHSLSTNHLEIGINDRLTKIENKLPMQLKFNVPLLESRDTFNQLEIPDFDRLHIYNAYHRKVDSLDDLKMPINNLTSFDSCTMILTVYDRVNSTLDRLKYYQNFTYLSLIVVIWNNINIQPSFKLEQIKLKIPVHILKMKTNSLNNRFYPYKIIKTDCIINMDDDWDMPYDHMAFAIDTWRGHFFHNLVGFSHQGRNHVIRYINGTLRYLYSHTVLLQKKLEPNRYPFYSIVLPSGFVYHRLYLEKYTYELPKSARDLVDTVQNCDDILFNFLVSNSTKQGPVIIDSFAKPYNFGGLWKRPIHFRTRTLCLNKFHEIFNGMPLKYTSSLFKINRNQTVPGKNKHIYQNQIPFNYPCSRKVLNESNACAFILKRRVEITDKKLF